jgi:hypothetical protein
MKAEQIKETKKLLKERNPDALLAEGFDKALIGIVQQYTKHFALYDKEKCISILMERDGMSETEAIDFFEYNVTGAWMGEYTPIFLSAW